MRAHPTQTILAVASRRHGICSRTTLLAAGISPAAIDRRIGDGTLLVVRRGLYEAPLLADGLTPLFRAVDAVTGAVLSRTTAGTSHRFPLATPAVVHITAPVGASRSIAGIVVHETRSLAESDVVQTADGLPVTSPARTIVDLAAELSPRHLRHIIETQLAIETPSLEKLQACFARLAHRGRAGAANLRLLLDELCADDPLALESELEARVWDGLRRCGVRGMSPQYKPPWFDGRRGVVDFAHPGAAVIVEADGRRWHARHEAMADDRRRDRVAVANGWVVVRLMWDDVLHRADETFTELAGIVEARLAERAA